MINFSVMRIVDALFLLVFTTNCTKRIDSNEPLQNFNNGSARSKILLDGKIWMTENLNIDIPESYCYQNDTINCKQYGHLYTWEAAKKGCETLGDDWRLPTNEEWQAMAKVYGGVVDDSDDNGKSAYANLMEGGQDGFNAVLGGNREANGNYERLGAHGFYWTATEYDSAEAWFYNFGRGSKLLNRHTGDKRRAVSVRCIRYKEKED
jgi:uncharacterized protein (TIGR02145 family)